ncbi:hypothetical protein GCM10027592_31860 [Spirosoma flavus]
MESKQIAAEEILSPSSSANDTDDYIYTGEQLLSLKANDVPRLLKGVFPQTGVVALAGSSDTGKSALLRQLACAIVLRRSEFIGFELNVRHGSVLYISTEDNHKAMSTLLGKQKVAGIEDSAYRELKFIFDVSHLQSKIEKQLSKKRVDCVIIDALADIYDGEMNAVNRVRSFLQIYSNIAQSYDCLVIFLHHTGKRTESLPPSKDNLIGSQGIEGKMRTVVEFRRDPTASAIRHFCIVKGNYTSDVEKERSFELHFDSQTLTFSPTGKQVDFKKLVKPDGKENAEWMRAKELALELHQQGSSIREIVAKLVEEGLPGGRSTVAKWVNEADLVAESSQAELAESVAVETPLTPKSLRIAEADPDMVKVRPSDD